MTLATNHPKHKNHHPTEPSTTRNKSNLQVGVVSKQRVVLSSHPVNYPGGACQIPGWWYRTDIPLDMPARTHKHPQHPPCPYCKGQGTIKYGKRRNQTSITQLYKCTSCSRRFSERASDNTTYPLRTIIDTLSLYNRGYTLEESARRAGKRHRLSTSRQTASTWKNRYPRLFPYVSIRDHIAARFSPHDLITTTRLHHGQVYDFAVHNGKLAHLSHKRATSNLIAPLTAYLEAAPTETPHDLFREARGRASQTKQKFSLDEVAITERKNIAVEMAAFVIPTVTRNHKRHEAIQTFMLANDTATVAMEVPIYLTHRDITHYTEKLGFTVPVILKPGETITGHIDILQVRKGKVHIVDYKPGAKKDKPVEQLMVYALALARRTGLRLMDFTCSWFDDEHYYEFEPLHVVHKLKCKRTS